MEKRYQPKMARMITREVPPPIQYEEVEVEPVPLSRMSLEKIQTQAVEDGYLLNTTDSQRGLIPSKKVAEKPVITVSKSPFLSYMDKKFLDWGLPGLVDPTRKQLETTDATDDALRELGTRESNLTNDLNKARDDYRKILVKEKHSNSVLEKQYELELEESPDFDNVEFQIALLDAQLLEKAKEETLNSINAIIDELEYTKTARKIIKDSASDSEKVTSVMSRFHNRVKKISISSTKAEHRSTQQLMTNAAESREYKSLQDSMIKDYNKLDDLDENRDSDHLTRGANSIRARLAAKSEQKRSLAIAKSLPPITLKPITQPPPPSPPQDPPSQPPPPPPPPSDNSATTTDGSEKVVDTHQAS